MPHETPWDLRDRVAAETLDVIREDRRRALVPVDRMLAEIERKLFDEDLQAGDVRLASGQRDRNLSTQFARETGLPPGKYLIHARMTVGARMLAAGNHKVWQIGVEVGYGSGNSFSRAFKTWCGRSPKAFRKEARAAAAAGGLPPPLPNELLNREERRSAQGGNLPADQAAALDEIQDRVQDQYHAPVPSVPEDGWVETVMAERLWGWIEVLPPEEQSAAVKSQARAFRTPALFHRLCTKCLEIGHDHDVRGLQIASLALTAMESIVLRLGKHPETLNLFARAHAVVGHAFRRSGYLDDAGEAFEFARRTLALAGDDAHPIVIMELNLYSAVYFLERDELAAARMLIDVSIKIYRAYMAKLAQQIER